MIAAQSKLDVQNLRDLIITKPWLLLERYPRGQGDRGKEVLLQAVAQLGPMRSERQAERQAAKKASQEALAAEAKQVKMSPSPQ